jgi:UDP-2,4-diacetamido-2,4,6-trideoxy-beta-L-altropyranose hydrolase
MNPLFRTDASVAIGTGHVMRCLALAQAWSDAGGRAIFAMAAVTPAVEERLRSEGFEVVPVAAPVGTDADAEETARLARQHNSSWVAVDGYEFGAGYQNALKSRDLKVLFIDDNGHAEHYSADLVLNQNPYASEGFYPNREAYTRLLLGPHYALLRREFNSCRGWKREVAPVAHNVLVTMGGSDPENFTRNAVQGIRAIDVENLRIRVLAGGSNPHIAALEEIRADTGISFELYRDATDMPGQMRWAEVAVAAAGSTCLEMCLMGLPALLIDLAENQTPIAKEFARRGTAYHLGSTKTVTAGRIGEETRRLLASAEERSAMSRRGQALVDGAGAERVARELLVS